MMTSRTLMLLAAGLGAALSGCGADVPEHPTWVADVRPIMVARCVRCHDATIGEIDPLSSQIELGQHAVGNFSYASLSDFTDPDKSALLAAPLWIKADTPPMAMPPSPAAKLADWQVETITRFVADLMNMQ